jgi:hypothetical protein
VIYESLIVPHEHALTIRELKRALLTYDKVLLVDPSDRDLMPSNAFMRTVAPFPGNLLGYDTGPVRPMGKSLGYDEQFARVIEEAQQAVSQGLVQVRSTYQKQPPGSFTFGGVPVGGFPLDMNFVLDAYRCMASDRPFVEDAISQDRIALQQELDIFPSIALPGMGDGGGTIAGHTVMPLPHLRFDGVDDQKNIALTRIARGRIGGLIKYAGYCDAKNLVPIFPSRAYGALSQRLINNARQVFSDVPDDEMWLKRSRVLQLCHEEFLADEKLDELSMRQILELRTTAWGRHGERREKLFASVYAIAQEAATETDFANAAQRQIAEYRKLSTDLLNERKRLDFSLKCDLAKGALGGGSAIAGLLAELSLPPVGIGVALAAGAIWVLDKAKTYIPMLSSVRAKEKALSRGAAFGLHGFYSRLD